MNPRLLWITENHPPSRGGMAQSSDRIVRGLRTSGIEIDVAHLTRGPRRRQVERVEHGHHLTVPLEGDPEHALRRLWTDVSRLALEAPPYTHVVAFGGTLPLLAAPTYAAWLELPLVTLLRGNDFDTGLFSLRRQGLVVDALRASTFVAVVASSNVPLVQRLAPDIEVRHITNGIDLSAWSVLPSERAAAADWRRRNVAGDRRVIGLFGQLKAKKGAVVLLDALAGSRFAAAAHVLLIGDTDEQLEAALEAHGTGPDTITASRLPFLDRHDLLAWYPACDLIALPSFYDGLPNVALEAAALGVPLLASDAGGLGDLVVDGANGFAFPAGDAAGCRSAIDRALRAAVEDLAQLGKAARVTVERDFTAERETAAYAELFRSGR